MAERTMSYRLVIVGACRHAGVGAMLSTSKLYPFNAERLERPDLIPAGTRTINMVQLAEALNGELSPPPVRAIYIYNSNPVAVCPDQNRVRHGFLREDLFTVVLEQFPTDTVDYADIVLPQTMQIEHADLHNGYGQMYLAWNEPAVAPAGECLSGTETFRRLADRMGLTEPSLYDSDEELAEQAMSTVDGITLDQLRAEGHVRLRVPAPFLPFADGFPTPSGKLEFRSTRAEADGLDPV